PASSRSVTLYLWVSGIRALPSGSIITWATALAKASRASGEFAIHPSQTGVECRLWEVGHGQEQVRMARLHGRGRRRGQAFLRRIVRLDVQTRPGRLQPRRVQ